MIETTWIGELARWIGRIFPRLLHLECTDIGVFITRGRRVKVIRPGLWVYWPIWTAAYQRPANVQTLRLPPQSLLTDDKEVVVAGGMIRYEFDRTPDAVEKALVYTDDVENAIEDEALGVFCKFITSKELVTLQGERTAINQSLTGRLKTALALYGVNVQRAQLTDFTTCVTLNHLGVRMAPHPEYEE
jgi:regulator of protease activity HflC (stomatin/prohibitin superfamily)